MSHDVILHVFYSQSQRYNLTVLKFLIMRGVGFEMCRIVISSHMISK